MIVLPFPSHDRSGVSSASGIRYLFPGYAQAAAVSSEYRFAWPHASPSIISKIRVQHGFPQGNGNTITYTLRVNGSNTALSVDLASNNAGAVGTGSVAVSEGETISVQVNKLSSVGTSPNNVTVTLYYE